MKIKLLGLQPGTYASDDTYDSYMTKQYELLERAAEKEKPYLAMFPELQTGPFFASEREPKWFALAEPFSGKTATTMVKKAADLGIHLVFSLFEKAEEDGQTRYYNSLGLASPVRGLIGTYRKTHIPWLETPTLNSYEKYYFRPGQSLPVYRLDNGVTVAMMLCYDRSFPEVWRTYYLQGAEVICMAACTWGFRGDFYLNELRTRAFESHAFVMVLNRAGDEAIEGESQVRKHFGKGTIINPSGDVVVGIEDEPWTYVAAEVDLGDIAAASRPLPWKRDRRPELYGVIAAQGANFNEQYVDCT